MDRAINIVEEALKKYGAPVYMRHEIVHNRFVVDGLRAKGAVFVNELDEVPDGVPVIFSAHGVPLSVPEEAERRGLDYLDATCPLVEKVHREAQTQYEAGRTVVLIGHAGHPEVVGTMGHLPDGAVKLVENTDQAAVLEVEDPSAIAYVSQTTLSVDDCKKIVDELKQRFPAIVGPRKEDVCFATTNRQSAVKAIAPRSDMLMVLGAPNSSNSRRLVEVASKNGCEKAMLVQRAEEIDWDGFEGVGTLGITAGASAPEILVEEVIDACRDRFDVTIEVEKVTEENVRFKLPSKLTD